MSTSPPSNSATDGDAIRPVPRVRSFAGWCRRRVYLWPLLITLALALPKLNQGGWSGDTPWYAAIALNAYRAQFEALVSESPSRVTPDALHPGDRWRAGLWVLPGLGGSPSSFDGGGTCNPERAGGGGEPYFNKPPLAFWLNGVWLWALGPTVFAARIGSVVACVLCVLLTTFIARRVTRDDLLASASGVILALTWEFVRHARAFSLDLWMVAALLAGIAGLLAVADSSTRRAWLNKWGLMGLGVGLALLVKPLVGLLALPIVGVWAVCVPRVHDFDTASTRQSTNQRLLGTSMGVAFGAVVALGVALPWHLSIHLRFPEDFAAQYFGRQIVDRAAGEGADFNRGASDPVFYLRLLGTAYWPWLPLSVLGMFGFVTRFRTSRGKASSASSNSAVLAAHASQFSALRLLALGTLWSLVWLGAISIFADKRPRYALVMYPGLAWCAAAWFCVLAPSVVRRAVHRLMRLVIVGVLIVGVVLAVAPVRMHRAESRQWTELFRLLAADKIEHVYAGALDGQRAARLYLDWQRWPVMPFNARGELVNDPPAGSLILYHRRDGRAHGPREEIVWQLDDLTLTRLTQPPWSPVTIGDPGE